MSVSLSYKNHFKFGYEDQTFFQPRVSSLQKFIFTFGQCEKVPMSFKDECVRSAQLIYEKFGKDIYLCYSGGFDSEFMINVFVEAKVPFKTAIMKFTDGLNKHDIKYALNWCEARGIKYNVIEINVKKFWSEDLFKYTDNIYCTSPQYAVKCCLIDKLDGVPIFGLGDNYIVREECKNVFYIKKKELDLSHYRHLIQKDRDGVPGFFLYRPEQILSYLMEKQIMDLILFGKQKKILSNTRQDLRHGIYSNYYKLKYREKYTGYEKLREEDHHYRDILKVKYNGCNSSYSIRVDKLIPKLWPQ